MERMWVTLRALCAGRKRLSSYATRPGYAARPVNFPDMLRTVWRWLTGRQPKPTMRQRMLEVRLVERLAEELEAAEVAAKGDRPNSERG